MENSMEKKHKNGKNKIKKLFSDLDSSIKRREKGMQLNKRMQLNKLFIHFVHSSF